MLSVYLSNLSGLVIATDECDSVWITNLEEVNEKIAIMSDQQMKGKLLSFFKALVNLLYVFPTIIESK